jgi:hypothetical protein
MQSAAGLGGAQRCKGTDMAELAMFVHAYAGGRYWERALLDVLAARANGGLEAQTYAGIVGNYIQAPRAKALLEPLNVEVIVEAETGWEQVTQEAMYRWALEHPGAYICYAHTKGAADLDPSGPEWNSRWRQSMAYHVIQRWQGCVAALDQGADAVGCHWLMPEEYPGVLISPHFGGTFWWVTASFLATLGPPPMDHGRHGAEMWIGWGPRTPKVYDLLPGWPGWGCCHIDEPCNHPTRWAESKEAARVYGD